MVMDKEQEVLDKTTQKRFQTQQLRKEAGMKDEEIGWSSEEYAAEIAAPVQRETEKPTLHDPLEKYKEESSVKVTSRSRRIGYTALLIAILSLFIWPAFLGPAAAILGVMAYMGGSRALGTWSFVLGLLSFAAYFLLIPYYS
jgi:hypothetical protein